MALNSSRYTYLAAVIAGGLSTALSAQSSGNTIMSPKSSDLRPVRVTIEDQIQKMPESDGIAAIRRLSEQGVFVMLPLGLSALATEELKIQFLGALAEPLSEDMISAIARESQRAETEELRFRCTGLLYRYRVAGSVNLMQAELKGGRSRDAALILASNREQDAIDDVINSLSDQSDLSKELLIALARCGGGKVNGFIAKRLDDDKSNVYLLLAAAIAGQSQYKDLAGSVFQMLPPAAPDRLIAAAAASIFNKEAPDAALFYLKQELYNNAPPFQLWPQYVMTALRFCRSEEAISLQKKVASGDVSNFIIENGLKEIVVTEAVLALADSESPRARAALVELLQADTLLLSNEHLSSLADSVARSGDNATLGLLKLKFPGGRIESRAALAKLKTLPPKYAPSHLK